MSDDFYFEIIDPMPEIDDEGLAEKLAGFHEAQARQLREVAKRLSISEPFQEDLRHFREEFDIPVPVITGEPIDADQIVRTYWGELDGDTANQLKRAIWRLVMGYGLDPLRHWGLVLGAIFYGLTPETVNDHWDRLKKLAIRGFPRVLQTNDLMRPDRERMAYLAVIKWLWLYITQKDRTLVFPPPVYQVIDEALSIATEPSLESDLNTLGEYIERTLSPEPVPALLIVVDEHTPLASVQRVWKLVKEAKAVFLDETQSEAGGWRTFARDVELMQLSKELDSYDEVIREHDRRHPDEHLIIDDFITDDVRELVRQAVHRVGERAIRRVS